MKISEIVAFFAKFLQSFLSIAKTLENEPKYGENELI